MPGLRWRSDASIPQPLTPGERPQQLYPVSQGLRAPPQEGGAGPCTRGLLGAALRPISAVLRQDRVTLWLSLSPVVRVDLYIFWGGGCYDSGEMRQKRKGGTGRGDGRWQGRGEPGPSDAEVGFSRGSLPPASPHHLWSACELCSRYCAFQNSLSLFLFDHHLLSFA